MISIIGFVLGLALAYIPVSCYLNYRKCPGIKGPFLASISSWWLFKVTATQQVYRAFPAALDKYDTNVVRVAPDKVATNDPEIWRAMCAPRSRFTRGSWYASMSLDPNHGNVLSCRDEKAHNVLRAKMIRGYSGKEIPNLESDIDDRIGDLLALIRKESAHGAAIDFAHMAQYFTLDVLTQIAFEKPVGFLTKNQDIFSYMKEVSGFLAVLELSCNIWWVQSIMNSKLMSGFSPKPTDKTGLGAMVGVAQEVVHRRYAPDAKDKQDMLGSFKKNGLTIEEAEAETMIQILAGSDSTATAVRMTFLYIITNPAVYAKLRFELDENAHRLTKPVLTSAEARNLPYLQACIKEGLRKWPPLTGLVNKVAPPGGETINGTFIPGGIEVCFVPFSMQMRKDIYGPDANIFRPERWLEAEKLDDGGVRLNTMERTLELVFGCGKYGCLGKTIAMIELDKIFATLLQNFDWGVVDSVNPIRTRCPAMHVQSDFWLRATGRVKV